MLYLSLPASLLGLLVVDVERFEFGQWLGLRGALFGNAIGRNLISGLPNKVLVNFDTVRRHGGGVIDD
jgi:hypothetical protein